MSKRQAPPRRTSTWQVQEAKARFSEMLETALTDGPQAVTKRGEEVAVLVAVEEWRDLQARARPSLKQLLLSDEARTDELVPPRRRFKLRPPVEFE
jgi:antitoxin Phd